VGVQRQVVRLEGTAATAVIMFVLVAAVVLLFHFLLRFLVAVIFVTFLFLGASLMFGCVLFVVAAATGSVVIVVVTVVTVVTLLCVCVFFSCFHSVRVFGGIPDQSLAQMLQCSTNAQGKPLYPSSKPHAFFLNMHRKTLLTKWDATRSKENTESSDPMAWP